MTATAIVHLMAETALSPAAPGPPPAESMAWIPGGTFLMGSDDFYPEERPVRSVAVDGFWIDSKAVTAAHFRRFVRETSYVTVAERQLDSDQYPDADPELLEPGSLVFRKAAGPTPLTDIRDWWEYVPGAWWKRPGSARRRAWERSVSLIRGSQRACGRKGRRFPRESPVGRVAAR